MTDPMLQALREEIVALRELLDETQRKAEHDYAALSDAYREVVQRQTAEMADAVVWTRATFDAMTTRINRESVDASCPF